MLCRALSFPCCWGYSRYSMELVFELQSFKGPLDLLLHLIGSAKIDIRDIFVSQVTDQYVAVLRDAGLMDMEEASEFISMAATLLFIKSRSMLPAPPEPEEDNPEELLIRQLEEYARFQQIASQMQGFEQAASRMFSKLPDEFPLPPVNYELEGLTLEGLIHAFSRISARLVDKVEDEAEKPSLIMLEQYSVPKCMANILRRTRRGSLSFSELLSGKPSRDEVVTLFLALLELLKQGRLSAWQEKAGEDIILNRGRREGTARGK